MPINVPGQRYHNEQKKQISLSLGTIDSYQEPIVYNFGSIQLPGTQKMSGHFQTELGRNDFPLEDYLETSGEYTPFK